LIRLLRKELAFQWRHNRSSMMLWLLVLLTVSTGLALLLWRDRWRGLAQQQRQQIENQRGLLELRVNQHRTAALDWGHWDTMFAFAGGEDPTFIARELLPSSIVDDQQMMLIVDSQGRALAEVPETTLDSSLRRCVQERLQRLRGLTPRAPMHVSFGVYCRSEQGRVVLGAGTGIRSSMGSLPERGWIFHLSTLERPSYNSSLNQTFREIDRAVAWVSTPAGSDVQPLPGISELLDPGESYVIQPRLSALETAREAALLSIPGWLVINLITLSLLPAGLLLARQQRLPARIRTLQDRRTDRKRRHQVSRVLMNRRHLLMALNTNARSFKGCWIGALHLQRADQGAAPGRRTLQNLAAVVEQRLGPRAMAAMDRQTLALAFSPGSGPSAGKPAAALASLQAALDSLWPEPGSCPCSGLVAPLQAGGETEQLLNLLAAASQLPAGTKLQLFPARRKRSDGSTLPEPGPGAPEGLPGESAPPAASVAPVMRIVDGQAGRLYDSIAAGEGSALGAALARLQEADAAGHSVGLPVAAATLADGGAELTAKLAALPLQLRRRLVLEVKESLLMASSEPMRSTARELQRLAVRIAIADFGTSHVPLQAVFGLLPSYLMLSADYTRSLHQDNVDSLVDFLLCYCRYKRCTLVLQGVETATELQYWQRKGVETFQGAACT